MYLRFVVQQPHQQSGHRTGVFQALFKMRAAGMLTDEEAARFKELVAWFGAHLPEPGRLAKSRHPRAKEAAISWFKASATQHIARMHEMVALLAAHGVAVDIVRTERPGYVVYEDEFQVAAEPFRDTRT